MNTTRKLIGLVLLFLLSSCASQTPEAPLSLKNSQVRVINPSILSGSTSTIEVTLKDTEGKPFLKATNLSLHLRNGTSDGVFGRIDQVKEGEYRALFTGTTSGTRVEVFAQATGIPQSGGEITGSSAFITVLPGWVDPTRSEVFLSRNPVRAGGFINPVQAGAGIDLSLLLRDASGNVLTHQMRVGFEIDGGDNLSQGEFGNIAFSSRTGVYTARFTARRTGDPVSVRAVILGDNGERIEIPRAGPNLQVRPGPYSFAQSTLALSQPRAQVHTPLTVTFQPRDAFGNAMPNLPVRFGVNELGGQSYGAFGLVQEVNPGVYQSQFTGALVGLANLQGRVEGATDQPRASDAQLLPGPPNPQRSRCQFLNGPPGVDPVSVISGQTINAELRLFDQWGNAVTVPMDQIQWMGDQDIGLSTGNWDNPQQQGTRFTARFTAQRAGAPSRQRAIVQIPGSDPISILCEPQVRVSPGPISQRATILTIVNPNLRADEDTFVNLELRDEAGNLLDREAEEIEFSIREAAGTSSGEFAHVQRMGSGRFRVQFHAITAGTPNRLQATVSTRGISFRIQGPEVSVRPSTISWDRSRVEIDPNPVQSGSSAVVRVLLRDLYDNLISRTNEAIEFRVSEGPEQSTGVFENVNLADPAGPRASFTGIKAGRPARISVHVNERKIIQEAELQVIPGPPSLRTSELTVSSPKVKVGQTLIATLKLRDENGNFLTSGGHRIGFEFERGGVEGRFGEVTDPGNGTYKVEYIPNKPAHRTRLISKMNEQEFAAQAFIEVEVNTFFGVKKWKPVSLKPVLGRPIGQIEQVNHPRPESDADYWNHIRACRDAYSNEWRSINQDSGASQSIDQKEVLKNAFSTGCWAGAQRAEVNGLREKIEKGFGELGQVLDSPQSVEGLREAKSRLIDLGRSYQEIQEHLSYCRAHQISRSGRESIHSLGVSGSDLNSEDKALLHVLGDTFGLESGLEGQNSFEKQALFLKRLAAIEKISVELKKVSYIPSPKVANPCAEIIGGYHPEIEGHAPPLSDLNQELLQNILSHGRQALEVSESMRQSLRSFSESYQRSISSLRNEGDGFYFLAGTAKHAMLYEVLKQSRDRYMFRVYNSGDGLGFHGSIIDGSGKYVFPFYEVRNITQARVSQFSFLKALRDLSVQPRGETNSNPAFVYDNVLKELRGEVTTFPSDTFEFMSAQKAGTCSYYVLPYADQARLKNMALANQLEFLIQTQVLDYYFVANKERLAVIEPVQRLFQKVTTYYSEWISENITPLPMERFEKTGRPIDWGMAREASERLEEYQVELERVRRMRQEQRESRRPLFSIHADRARPALDFTFLQVKGVIDKVQDRQIPMELLGVNEWDPARKTPDQVLADLNGFIQKMYPKALQNDSNRKDEIQSILEGVREISKRLPLDRRYWGRFSAPQLKSILESMSELSQLHLWSLVQLLRNEPNQLLGVHPVSILAQIKVLTLTEVILERYGRSSREPEVGLFQDFPSLFHPYFNGLVFPQGKNQRQWIAQYGIESLDWQKVLLEELVPYWEAERVSSFQSRARNINEPIFQWTRYPLYFSAYLSRAQRIFKRDDSAQILFEWSSSFGSSNVRHLGWNDLKWVSQKGVRHSSVKDLAQMHHYSPHLSSLPVTFFDVRDISFITHYLVSGSFDSEILNKGGLSEQLGDQYFRKRHGERVAQAFNFNPSIASNHPDLSRPENSYDFQGYTYFGLNGEVKGTQLSDPKKRLKILSNDFPPSFTGNVNVSIDLATQRAELGLWNNLLTQPINAGDDFNYLLNLSSSEIVARPQVLHRIPTKEDFSILREVPIATLEVQRQLLNLNSPLTVLSYFSEHPQLLREKRWQILFKTITFQPTLLAIEHQKNPLFYKSLARFLYLNSKKSAEDEDLISAAFFARMGQLLHEWSSEYGPSSKSLNLESWNWSHDAQIFILGKLKDSMSDLRSILYRDLIRGYRYVRFSALRPQDLSMFVIGMIYRQRHPLTDIQYFDAEEENASLGVYALRSKELQDRMISFSPPEKDQTLNEIMTYFTGTPFAGRWQSDQGQVIWVGVSGAHGLDRFQIDLTRPQVLIDGSEQRPLPAVISSLPKFKEVISWNPEVSPYAKWLGGSRYEFRDFSDGHLVRIDAEPTPGRDTPSIVIQKKWGNQWYELLDDQNVNQEAVIGDEKSIPEERARSLVLHLMPGFQNWQSVAPPSDQSNPDPPAYEEKYTDFQRQTDWDAESPLRGRTEFLAIESKSHKLYSVARVVRGGGLLIQKAKTQDSRTVLDGTTLHFVDPLPKEDSLGRGVSEEDRLSLLTRIEIPRFIWVWKNGSGVLDEVELPRFGIRFFSSDGKLKSAQLDGFFLSEQQWHPDFGNNPHYLLIENEEGKVRAIVPRFQFDAGSNPLMKEKSLLVHYRLKWWDQPADLAARGTLPVDRFGVGSQKYFVWPVDSFSGHLTQPFPHSEDRFFYSLMQLWERSTDYDSYEHARDLLYSSRSQLGDYRLNPEHQVPTGAREVLGWMNALSNNDYDPRALALRLGAGLLILENELANQRWTTLNIKDRQIVVPESLSEVFQAQLSEQYTKFLEVKSRLSTHWLPEDLEMIFLKWNAVFDPEHPNVQFQNRLAELSGKNPEKPITSEKGTETAEISFRLSERDFFEALGSSFNGQEKNLFLSFPFQSTPVHLERIYQLALNLQDPRNVELLRDVLAGMLEVGTDDLRGLTHSQLRDEFLSLLRLILRQGIESDDPQRRSRIPGESLHFARAIYALALKGRVSVGFNTLEKIRDYLNGGHGSWAELNDRRQRVFRSLFGVTELETEVAIQLEDAPISQNIGVSGSHGGELSYTRARFWDSRNEIQRYQTLMDQAQAREGGQEGQDARRREAHYHEDFGKNRRFDLREPVIPIPMISRMIEEVDLSGAEAERISVMKRGLMHVFSKAPLHSDHEHQKFDPFISKKLGSASRAMDLFPERKAYHWKGQGIEEIFRELNEKARESQAEAKRLQEEIEIKLKNLPVDSFARAREILYRMGSVEKKVTLNQVLQDYANKNLDRMMITADPSSGPAHLDQWTDLITAYLIASTYYFRTQDILQAFKPIMTQSKVGAAQAPPTDEIRLSEEDYRRIYKTAVQTRSYPIAEHPDYLVFEYMMRVMIRDDQVRNLDLLSAQESHVVEMIMGAGKTSVLLPLASHLNAVPGSQLSVVVLPESLLPSMVQQLSAQLDLIFGQGVDRIGVLRKDKYDFNKLEHLYIRLKRDLDLGRVVVTSNSSLQSLFLIFIEALNEYSQANGVFQENKSKEIVVLQNIFSLFKGHAHVLIDEVDSILDIMASHRFSVGKKSHLEESIINASIGLYHLLAEYPEITQGVKIPFRLDSGERAIPFNRDAYRERVRPRIIDLVTSEGTGKYFFDHQSLVAAFDRLDRRAMKVYFNLESREEARRYLESIPLFEAEVGVGIHSTDLRNVLSVLFTQINQTLPMTLEKSYLVHYGLCRSEHSAGQTDLQELQNQVSGRCDPLIGIPYHSGSPVYTSRFGSDLEALNYTIQSHIESRDVFIMFRMEIEGFQKVLKMTKNLGIKRKILVQASDYFGREMTEGQILNLQLPDMISQSKQVSQVYRHVLKLVKRYAAPKIEVFPEQLFTNSHIYPVIFKKIRGMSGTLWNYESFPEFFSEVDFSDSMARTLMAIWRNRDSHRVFIVDSLSAKASDSEIVSAMFQTVEQASLVEKGTKDFSIIDQGGFFRGRGNASVASAMLDAWKNELSQVIYYDERHQIQLMKGGGRRSELQRTSTPYAAQDTDRKLTGAFWDMRHTTGSDLKVNLQSRAILTLSKFTIMRDLLQSAWRLRDLEVAQSVILMVTRDDLQIMSKLLVEVYGESEAIDLRAPEVPLEKILLYLATHEAIKVGELNFRSVKGSQKSIVIDSLFTSLVTKPTGRELVNAFGEVRAFFSTMRGEQPYHRYGVPIVEVGTLEYLTAEIKRVFDPVKELFEEAEQLYREFRDALRAKSESLRRFSWVSLNPDEVEDEEMEVESEAEQEQEQEQEQEEEIQLHDMSTPFSRPKVAWNRRKFELNQLLSDPTRARQLEMPLTQQAFGEISPVIPIHEMLSMSENRIFQAVARYFDVRLFGSLNLFPVFKTEQNQGDYEPFGLYQGRIDDLLVFLDRRQQVTDCILLTRDEALEEIGDWMDHRNRSDGTQALIYRMGAGFVRASGGLVSDAGGAENLERFYQRLEGDSEFLRYLVQAKFLSGRTDYSEAEVVALRGWLRGKDKQVLRTFFRDIVLSHHQTTLKDYEYSVLFYELSLE